MQRVECSEQRILVSDGVMGTQLQEAGLAESENGSIVYKESPADRARSVTKMLGLGINIIGGCCGSGPAHIKATREAVDRFIDNGG